MGDRLEFRGGSTALFGDILVVAFLSAITLGLYAPWGVARMCRAVLERTFYRGESLRYDGTGGELFGLYLRTALLTLVTFGFYALLCYPSIAFLKYNTSHTILPDGSRLEYRGTAGSLFSQLLVVLLLTMVTLGIYSFWGYAAIRRHVVANTYTQHGPMRFMGTGGEFLAVALTNAFLSAITLGIYDLLGCAMVRQATWVAASTEMPALPSTGHTDTSRPIQVNVTVNV